MQYPVFIFPSDEPVQIWEYNGCIFSVSRKGVTILCRPKCTPSGCQLSAVKKKAEE